MSLTLREREKITGLIEEGVVMSADRLGKMSRTEWGVMSSSTNEFPAVRLLTRFTRSKEPHVGARLRTETELAMEMLILFSARSARAVTDVVTKPFSDRLRRLPDLVPLTIAEVSNVMGQSVVGALADRFGRALIVSAPEVKTGTKADLLGEAFDRYDGRKDVLLMSHVELYSMNLAAECSMVTIVESAAIRDFLASTPV
ncbi:MAG: hypothetical protein ABII00_13010 [Elusimicrobiota bacterium]